MIEWYRMKVSRWIVVRTPVGKAGMWVEGAKDEDNISGMQFVKNGRRMIGYSPTAHWINWMYDVALRDDTYYVHQVSNDYGLLGKIRLSPIEYAVVPAV